MSEPAVEPRRGGTPLRRRMGPRDRDQAHRAATPLELLFDLCFVVAVAQAADRLHHALLQGRTGDAVISYISIFFAIWWAWMNFTWFASAYDTDDVAYRLLTLLQIGGVLLLAAGVAAGFDRRDFTAVTVGYVLMRVAMVTQWLRVAHDHPAGRATALRYAGGVAVLQLGWISLLALPPTWRGPGFLLLATLELAVPVALFLVVLGLLHTWVYRYRGERAVARFSVTAALVVLAAATTPPLTLALTVALIGLAVAGLVAVDIARPPRRRTP